MSVPTGFGVAEPFIGPRNLIENPRLRCWGTKLSRSCSQKNAAPRLQNTQPTQPSIISAAARVLPTS